MSGDIDFLRGTLVGRNEGEFGRALGEYLRY